MKQVLTIYTGLCLGFIMTTILYSTRFTLLDQTTTDISTMFQDFNPLEDAPGLNKANNCFETAIPCPPFGPCNCHAMCGRRFKVAEVTSESDVIYLNQKLYPGRYCLPDDAIQCPRQFAFTLFDANGKSTCACKYPTLFGGPYCNEKQACQKGALIRQDTGLPMTEYDMANDNYTCKCFKDKNGNTMTRLPGDQLNCVSDPCLALMVAAPSTIGMTHQGLCYCGTKRDHRVDNLYPGNKMSPCTHCVVQWLSPTQVKIPLRCMSAKGAYMYAPPCRDFNSHFQQCENTEPVHIQVLD